MDTQLETSQCFKTTPTRICWSSIIAGALVGVGLGFLLNLFSMAIGLSAYSSSAHGAHVLAIGGVIGLFIGAIATMGTAGLVAGYLGRFHHCYCHGGVIYGFLTWSLALMLSAVLIMPIARYMSFYEDNIGPSATAEMASAANLAQSDNTAPAATSPAAAATAVPPQNLAWSSWIIFALFFVGAFSSCIGACCGMRCRCERTNNLNQHTL